MKDPARSFTQIEILPATAEDQAVLANLLELYVHDFSEFADLKIGLDGRFGYDPLSLYWQESNLFPFLIKANGSLAGFVLVQQGSQLSSSAEVWDMAEFFVLRGYRRAGVGMKVAHTVWRNFPGAWEVRVIEQNLVAQAFWQHAVCEFTGLPATARIREVDGKRWQVFSFSATPPPNQSLDAGGISSPLLEQPT